MNDKEIIDDLKSKPQVPIKGNTLDFIKKFSKQQADEGLPSGTNVGDPTLGMKREEEPPVEEVIGNDKKEGEPKPPVDGKKKGFVEKQIEENRKLKEELEKYKKDEIPKYESKIAELEDLVKNSSSTSEANHYQKQLNEANMAKTKLEEELTGEITSLRRKLDFHDLSSNPDFQNQYIRPIQDSYSQAREVLGQDSDLQSAFQRAVAANTATFSAQSVEEQQAAIKERDEALEEITNSLSSFKQVRFADQVVSYLKATENHARALTEFERTKQEINQNAKRKEIEARSNFLKTWKTSFQEQQDAITKETFIPEDVYSYMKEKGIKYDTSKDEAIALAATQQSDEQASVDDMNRLINQGRAYKKIQAQVKALTEMLKEKDEYIGKLKGSSRVSSSSGSATDSQQPRLTVSEGLKAKLARFSPQNRAA
jgi:hypothetical protein